jgi:signal transduction histidine kinase
VGEKLSPASLLELTMTILKFKRPWIPYAIAFGAILFAGGIQFAFWSVISPMAFFLFYPTVFGIAVLLPPRPAFAGLLLADVWVFTIFMEKLGFSSTDRIIQVSFFTVLGILFIRMGDKLRTTWLLLQERENELTELMKLRDNFVSIASHELKTPVTGLQLQLYLLDKDVSKPISDGENLKKRVRVCNQQIRNLVRLIDSMLDVSRMQAGRIEIQKQEANLTEVTEEVVSRLRDEAELAHCPLKVDLDPGVWGTFDPVRVGQAVSNLVSNALKYGPGKPISLALKKSPNEARITVRDEGIGIDAQDQARIFSIFERAVDRSNMSGLGIGLYLAKEIIDLHGGNILVSSTPNQGSSFEIILPLGSVQAPQVTYERRQSIGY